MTHSLHREGTKENLADDYTIYCLPAIGKNDKGSGTKRWRFLKITLDNNAANAGLADIGNIMKVSKEKLLAHVEQRYKNSPEDGMGDGVAPCICCSSKQDILNILKEALAADFGLSIMVQGLREEVCDCLQELGLKPHTIHHSLGVWGRTDKLPSKEILEITTMCGHGMCSPSLVKKCIEDIIRGKTTPAEAAKLLAAQCVCGIFNPVRAEELLARLTSNHP